MVMMGFINVKVENETDNDRMECRDGKFRDSSWMYYVTRRQINDDDRIKRKNKWIDRELFKAFAKYYIKKYKDMEVSWKWDYNAMMTLPERYLICQNLQRIKEKLHTIHHNEGGYSRGVDRAYDRSYNGFHD
jgi:hypothetical protein